MVLSEMKIFKNCYSFLQFREYRKGINIRMWKVKVKLLSHVQLFASLWTVAHQAPPPSMGFFPGKNTRVGCHFLLRGSAQPRDWTQVSHTAGKLYPLSHQGIWNTYLNTKIKSLFIKFHYKIQIFHNFLKITLPLYMKLVTWYKLFS